MLADSCKCLLEAIEKIFNSATDGPVTLVPDRRRVDELLARMQIAEIAVQRARSAGVSWDAIQGVAQLAWPLACEVFEALGWAEAF